MNTETRKPTAAEINDFASKIAERLNARTCYTESTGLAHATGVELGRKYARIWKASARNGEVISHTMSVVGFVSMEDGSLWKAAGWKSPARNYSRGSLFNDPMNAVDSLGFSIG